MKSNRNAPVKHEIKQNNTHKNMNKATLKNMISNKTMHKKHELKQNNTNKT